MIPTFQNEIVSFFNLSIMSHYFFSFSAIPLSPDFSLEITLEIIILAPSLPFERCDLWMAPNDLHFLIICSISGHAMEKLPDVAPLAQEHLETVLNTAFNLGLYSNLEVVNPICDTLTLMNGLAGYWLLLFLFNTAIPNLKPLQKISIKTDWGMQSNSRNLFMLKINFYLVWGL